MQTQTKRTKGHGKPELPTVAEIVTMAEDRIIDTRGEGLAEAARLAVARMEAAGIGFGEVELREALAQWEGAK